MKKLVILTGAGISAESGIATFRDSNGLWEKYNVDDVATPKGWLKDKELVLKFYNERRDDIRKAQPNAAHYALAELQDKFDTTIVTQNIDDLHERAGSRKVLHLHGEIMKMRSTRNPSIVLDCPGDINLGDKCPEGSQLRPFVVWFGEDVPMLWTAEGLTYDADIFVVIGTSLQVYPAAGLIGKTQHSCKRIIIDPVIPKFHEGFQTLMPTKFIEKTATQGVIDLKEILEKIN